MAQVSFLFLFKIRQYIRRRDSILETQCTFGILGCEDCCCASCCGCCVLAQVMRHEGLVKGRYSLFEETGTIEV